MKNAKSARKSEPPPRSSLTLVRGDDAPAGPDPAGAVRRASRAVLSSWGEQGPLVAECLEETHPVLCGRALVRVVLAVNAVTVWLPVLQGVVLRRGDHVLLQSPRNWPEPVVVGVLDGFEQRRERSRTAAAALELRADERLEVRSREGQRLAEIWEEAGGPVVRLLSGDANLQLSGKLSVEAQEILLSARDRIRVEADGNVDLAGDIINLN